MRPNYRSLDSYPSVASGAAVNTEHAKGAFGLPDELESAVGYASTLHCGRS